MAAPSYSDLKKILTLTPVANHINADTHAPVIWIMEKRKPTYAIFSTYLGVITNKIL